MTGGGDTGEDGPTGLHPSRGLAAPAHHPKQKR